MREIKFRGKRIDNGEWKYGDLLHIVGGCVIYHGSHTDSTLIEDRPNLAVELYMDEVSPVVPDTVGQYTGLKDKNGKEIYEGDILQSIGTDIFVEVIYDAPEFCYRDNNFGYKFLNRPGEFEVVGNIHDKQEPAEKKAEGYKGVALFGYPFLFHNGDLGFHEKMEELCLTRGSTILCGLPNMCILANKREYLLTDYDKEEDFCEQYKLKATYSVEDFIQGIKELKSE